MSRHYLAFDLGAESGRLMLGSLDSGKLHLEEVHRFPNTPIRSEGSLLWDMPRLVREISAGLKRAGQRQLPIESISTDSWGVDYLLFAEDGSILEPTYHYRDPRTQKGVDAVLAKVNWNTLFHETGIQFMPINTVFQLAAESAQRLKQARLLLGVADGIHYMLTGKPWAEESLASTTQLYNPRARAWSEHLLSLLQLPRALFPPVVPSGTRLGPLRAAIAEESGLANLEVVAACSHDTAAAVAAVPASGPHWAYLSSGTWSLIGTELPQPIITEKCRELNFTNELGYGRTTRLLKNIIGLWMVQECRREWARAGEDLDYAALTQMAAEAKPFVSLVNPADKRFLGPDEMPAKIAAFCRETGQPVPETPGATIRCVLESLALLYRRALKQIEQLAGYRIERLHIVGGGSKNDLLNQFTANAVQIPVEAGPAEATAAGNVLVQALTMGQLGSLEEARQVARNSSEIQSYQPEAKSDWMQAYSRLERLME